MNIEGWRYYNHAAVPTCAPHQMPDLAPVKDGSIWKMGGRPYFATWTEDYDCDEKTEWWYCILDKPFDILTLKAKRRYNINKGSRLFEVREIEPLDYQSELLKVQIAAFSAYPEKYRPTVYEEEFYKSLKYYSKEAQTHKIIFYGAFYRETGELCGYHIATLGNRYRSSSVLKTNPEFEKYQINAALVYKWVSDAEAMIKAGGYLANGTRTINHESAFQDYLEYYFGFRKAYCRLGMQYSPAVKLPVRMISIFKYTLAKHDDIGMIHVINAVLKMDEISQMCSHKIRTYGLFVQDGISENNKDSANEEYRAIKRRITIKSHGIRAALFWNLISMGRCSAYRVYLDDGSLIHESLVIHKCYKFPFLKFNDVEIGPCYTEAEWRGKGIYPSVLKQILAEEISRQNKAMMIIDKNNAPSIRGVEKAGFHFERNVKKTGILKIYKKLLV